MTNVSDVDLQLKKLMKGSPLSNQMYEPELLRLGNSSDFDRFVSLLTIPGLVVCDQLLDQIKELIKLQHPSRKLSAIEVDQIIEKKWQSQAPLLYGVWAFYPWSNRLVHILDKDEFIEVRTSRNQYKITPEEREILSEKIIGVIGLSVGQSVSVTMAMERICGELRLADFDLLELTNLNRIRTGVQNLGILKVHSVAREIAEMDPYIKVRCFQNGLTEENMDEFFMQHGKLDLVVEESDGFDIKVLARYKARELQVPVIMEASDRCMVDVERFDLEPNRPILHGILDHLDVAKLKTLTTNEEKIPYMFDILGLKSTSTKLRASMLEMQQTITTWPQLASAVTMGGGITADVSRRMLLNNFKGSGRYYVDIDELIGDPQLDAEIAELIVEPTSRDLVQQFERCSLTALPSVELNEYIEALIGAASKAPSFSNAQNWLWTVKNNNLFLLSATHNTLQDPDSNLQLMSAGTALENMVQQAKALGFEVIIKNFPSPNNLFIVAQVAFKKSNNKISNVADQISRRHTNRMAFSNEIIRTELLSSLDSQAKSDRLTLKFISDPKQIDNLAKHLAIAEKINLLHPQLHASFFQSMLKNDSNSNNCLSISDFQLPPAVATAFSVVADASVAKQLREWEKGTAFENHFYSVYSSSAAIGIICANDHTPETLLEAGRALEQVWLTCTKNNLAFQPICVPLTVLKNLQHNGKNFTSFNDKEVAQLHSIETEVKSNFNLHSINEAVCLFRIGFSKEPIQRAKRKSINEIFVQSNTLVK
jgi:hypothetical protein